MRRNCGVGSVMGMGCWALGTHECCGQEDEGGGEDIGEGWHGE